MNFVRWPIVVKNVSGTGTSSRYRHAFKNSMIFNASRQVSVTSSTTQAGSANFKLLGEVEAAFAFNIGTLQITVRVQNLAGFHRSACNMVLCEIIFVGTLAAFTFVQIYLYKKFCLARNSLQESETTYRVPGGYYLIKFYPEEKMYR